MIQSFVPLMVERGPRVYSLEGFGEWDLQEHRGLFEAVRDRDSERPREVMRDSYRRARPALPRRRRRRRRPQSSYVSTSNDGEAVVDIGVAHAEVETDSRRAVGYVSSVAVMTSTPLM